MTGGLGWRLVLELLVLGSCTGFLAGLLGIGGGMLMVPCMFAAGGLVGLLAALVGAGGAFRLGAVHDPVQREDPRRGRNLGGAGLPDRGGGHGRKLKRVFACLLFGLAAYMTWKAAAL